MANNQWNNYPYEQSHISHQLFFKIYFGIIADSHAVVRNNMERSLVPFSHFPSVEKLTNFSTWSLTLIQCPAQGPLLLPFDIHNGFPPSAPLLNPDNLQSVLQFCYCASSRTSYEWNHIVYGLVFCFVLGTILWRFI